MTIEAIFGDPKNLVNLNYVQLLLLMCGYMYLLTRASSLIDYGSGMLMLVIDPGLICGLVLPILGALPDAATVLFSGLGPADSVQNQINVGMGSLAGSSIMLLTLPWAAAVFVGRADLDIKRNEVLYRQRPKLTKGMSATRTGVQTTAELAPYAWVMLATVVSYLVVIIVSAASGGDEAVIRDGVLAGFILCCILFVAYAATQVLSHAEAERQKALLTDARKDALANQILSLADLFAVEMERAADAEHNRDAAAGVSAEAAGSDSAPLLSTTNGSLQGRGAALPQSQGENRMGKVIRHMFAKFDMDMSGLARQRTSCGR